MTLIETIKFARRTIALLSSMVEGGEVHTSRSRDMKDNALEWLKQLEQSSDVFMPPIMSHYHDTAMDVKERLTKQLQKVTKEHTIEVHTDTYWRGVKVGLETAIEVALTQPSNEGCKYVKREGESCTLNNNCTYPNCTNK